MLNLMMGTHAVVYPSTGFYDINIYLSQAKQIKDAVQIPCMVGLGVQTASLAESILESGQGDFIALAKQEIADCNWPNKVKNNQEDDIRPCISCHFGCLARIFQVDMKTMSSKDISCALNPRCGMENHYNITKADVIKKVAVVGGGIAGMEAARVAALRGHSVDLYEKTDRLGGVFNEASAFDFKDDDRRLLAWYKKQIKDAGVNVKFNTEFKVEDKANYDVVFVATGASESSGTTDPFGLPRCEQRITLPPSAISFLIVGNDETILVSSVITPLSSGTLKSHLRRTLSPDTLMSSIVFLLSILEIPSRF